MTDNKVIDISGQIEQKKNERAKESTRDMILKNLTQIHDAAGPEVGLTEQWVYEMTEILEDLFEEGRGAPDYKTTVQVDSPLSAEQAEAVHKAIGEAASQVVEQMNVHWFIVAMNAVLKVAVPSLR